MIPNSELVLTLGKKGKMVWEYKNINMFSKWEFRVPIREREANTPAWKSSVIINMKEIWKAKEIVDIKWYVNL